MKKLFAILLALVMLFALSATAMAIGDADGSIVPVQALSWITAERGIQQAEIAGTSYTIHDTGLDIWIPDLLQPVEEIPEYSYGVFAAENNAASISLNHLDFDPEQTLEDIEKLVPDWGAESDGIFVVNDTYALVYETKEEDSLSILILLGEGNALEVVVTPISNKDVYSIASLVMASIRPTEPTMKDIGVMMDADIKSFWGDSRDVRMADDENGRSISIFMWEDGITSETVKDINNWDEVRAAKINLYNAYVDVLEEFDMNDILLRLSYISADQDVAFFSIEGGQITYDVFEDAAA